MTRVLAYSLHHIAQQKKWDFKVLSAYDADESLMEQYIPASSFKGFRGSKTAFAINTVMQARSANLVILSHVNMAIVGLLVKMLNPRCKVWLVAHGIEIWRPLNFIKQSLLRACDKIVCVSNYTRQQIIHTHGISAAKCEVLNNALDPLMRVPDTFDKPQHLLAKYNLSVTDPVVFTLTRLASTEQYKGYEQVIGTIANLKTKFPTIKYMLSGEYDEPEKKRIDEMIRKNDVVNEVILTGFLPEEELTDYFLLADVFVLPSRKEGFGIVFIEALACGLPVICGNADGSVDAIKNGALGIAVDVNDTDALSRSIQKKLSVPLTTASRKALQRQCINFFGEEKYRDHLQQILTN